jgi:predicted acylesterase/phospholipase RssA
MTLAERSWNMAHALRNALAGFYYDGLMDLIRTALVVVLVYIIWAFRMPGLGGRPLHDFVLWGVRFPFPCLVVILVALILWGALGADYGLQALFFGDPTVQVQLGMMASLAVLAMIYHCYVSYNSASYWRDVLQVTLEPCGRLNSLLPRSLSIFSPLRNGFLEHLDMKNTPNDVEVIERALRHKKARDERGPTRSMTPGDQPAGDAAARGPASDPAWVADAQLLDLIQYRPMFRVLFAPATLFVNAVYVVLLLGLVPCFLSHGRSPWLIGSIVGAVLGLAIACWSSRRLSIASGDWSGGSKPQSLTLTELQKLLESARRAPPPDFVLTAWSRLGPGYKRSGELAAILNAWPAPNWRFPPPGWQLATVAKSFAAVRNDELEAMLDAWLPPERRAAGASWLARSSLAFLPIHLFITGFVAWYAPWVTSRSSRPEPWALLTLAAEVAIAAILGWPPFVKRVSGWIGRHFSMPLPVIIQWFAGAILTLLILILIVTELAEVFPGLTTRPPLLLISYLAIWLACFALATSESLVRLKWDSLTRKVAVACLATTVLGIIEWSAQRYVVAVLFGIIAVFLPAFHIITSRGSRVAGANQAPPVDDNTAAAWWRRRGRTFIGFSAVLLLLVLLASNGTFAFDGASLASLWLTAAILALGVLVLSAILPSTPHGQAVEGAADDTRLKDQWQRFALVYPLSAIFAFAAFAMTYSGLDESKQALMPAGASLLALLGLLGSVFLAGRVVRPRRSGVVIVCLVAGAFLLNGNSWRSSPNQFKLRFPGLRNYYDWTGGQDGGRDPVSLDTRAYFRATASSVVKLRSTGKVRAEEMRSGANEGDLPASVYFEIDSQGLDLTDKQALVLGVSDPRGSCRVVAGDHLVLYLPEEFLLSREAQGLVDPKEGVPFWTFLIKEASDKAPLFVAGHRESSVRLSKKVLPDAYRKADRIRLQIGSASVREGDPVPENKVIELARFEPSARPMRDDGVPSFEVCERPADRGPGEEIWLIVRGLKGGMPRSVFASAVFDAKARAAERRPEIDGRSSLHFLILLSGLKGWQDALVAENDSGRPGPNGTFVEALRNCFEDSHLALDRALALNETVLSDDRMLNYTIWRRLHPQPGDILMLEGRPDDIKRRAGPVAASTWAPEEDDPKKAGSQPSPLHAYLAPLKVWDDPAGVPREEPFDSLGAATTIDRPLEPISSGALKRLIAQNKWHADRLSLRVVHDRSIFRFNAPDSSGETLEMDLAHGERARIGDLLILHWFEGAKGPEEKERFELAMVEDVDPTPSTKLGLNRVRLARWGRRKWTIERPAPAPGVGSSAPVWGTWEIVRALNSLETLEAWKRRVEPWWRTKDSRKLQVKPPLVIVAVSGGGIRASTWTATVLETLERTIGPEFPYHIRLITGASGGMVSAAAYAGGLEAPPLGDERPPARDPSRIQARLMDDQLNSVAGCMVFNDLPGLLNPLHRAMDRGEKIEEAWIRLTGGPEASPLARPFRGLIAGERAGWRPSLAFTPMFVEDGRRLLISNLELGFISRNYGRLLKGWNSEKLDPAYLQDLQPFSRLDDEIFSLSAVEFFRLFPAALDVKVATAARMSASFPWVAPPVSLPTSPPRRVVDAGYYDNYGINLAAKWLTEYRHWLAENTSGVLVVQIRDGVSQKARTQISFDQPTEAGFADTAWIDRFTWIARRELIEPGFYPLTTPLRGLTSARQWSMSFRNDEQIELFDRLLDELRAGSPDFFRTVVFECPVEASVSWNLTDNEKNMIRAGMGDNPKLLSAFKPYSRPVLRNFREEHKHAIEALDFRRDVAKTLSQEDYIAEVKKLQDAELDKLGYAKPEERTNRESDELYNNVMDNVRRLELVRDWWRARSRTP